MLVRLQEGTGVLLVLVVISTDILIYVGVVGEQDDDHQQLLLVASILMRSMIHHFINFQQMGPKVDMVSLVETTQRKVQMNKTERLDRSSSQKDGKNLSYF